MSDFDLKKFSSALKYYVPDDIKLEKEGIKLLYSILCKINTNFVNAILSNAENLQVINAKTTQKSIEPLLPKSLKRHAFANVSRDVCLYNSGLLTYEEKLIRVKHAAVDFKDPVKRILQDFNSIAARGFLPRINEYLNDLCYALAKKSSENAKNNNGVLTENDIFFAINEVLPLNLRQHAFARISYLQKHSLLPPTSTNAEPTSTSTEPSLTSIEPTSTSTESELPVPEDDQVELVEHAAETDQTQEGSSWSVLNIAKQLLPTAGGQQATEEQDKKVDVDETSEKGTSRTSSFLGAAWGWFSSSSTTQTEAKESENEESMETVEE